VTPEARKPLFGFIFAPKPATPGAGQVSWLRIPARGPWRLTVLIISTLFLASVLGTALLSLAATRNLEGVVIEVLTLLAMVPIVFLVARGWVTGTYVNDSGVRVVRIKRSDFAPWSIVTGIDVIQTGRGLRLVVETSEGTIDTTIGSFTWDTALREQTWLASVDRMRIWLAESRG
jgi:hypothetical protein